jgi:hypothetical protein
VNFHTPFILKESLQMQKIYTGGKAVIVDEADLFSAETKNLWETILQRTLAPEETESLIAQFTDFGMFIREVVLNKSTQTADKGVTATSNTKNKKEKQ